MKKIPQFIKYKLQSIENHQYSVRRLIDEVIKWAGLNEHDFDDINKWTWGMHIDLQGGGIYSAKDSESLLIEFFMYKELRRITEGKNEIK